MRFTITGRNIEVTQGLREAVEDKLGKLDRFFAPATEAVVRLSVQKDIQKIEVTIPVKGHIIRAEESSSDMYVSIDLVEEILERQLKKYKNKLIDKKQSGTLIFFGMACALTCASIFPQSWRSRRYGSSSPGIMPRRLP